MQKKATLKFANVFLLRRFFSVLLLCISLQAGLAQSPGERKAMLKTNPGRDIVPVFPSDADAGKQQAKQFMAQANQFSVNDVPVSNKMIIQESLKGNPVFSKVQPNFQLATPATLPTNNIVEDVCTFNGGLVAGDATLTNRFFRDGAPSVCGTTKVCPGPFATPGAYYYDTYTMQNLTCQSQCVTVQYISNGTGNVFGVVYNGSFSATNLCTNYMADGGSSSAGASVSFGVTVPANTTIVLVLMEATSGEACPSYTMVVTGINCTPPPPCTPITSAVLSQVQYPGPMVSLYNLNFDGAAPFGLTVQNLSNPLGSTGWAQTNALVFNPHGGAGKASANYNNTGNNGTISNWMFMPTTLMKNGDVFSFWTRTVNAPAYPDRLQVRMNTNNTGTNVGSTEFSVGDYTNLLLDINPAYTLSGYPNAWTQYTLTLSGLPAGGVNGRIALRYFVENAGLLGVNSDFIAIDDAQYQTSTFVNPTTCVGSSVNLKVDINGGNPGATYNMVLNANPPGGPAGNFSVNGYTSGSNISVTPSVNTTYSIVSIVDASNPCCISTNNSGTPTVVVAPGPVPAISITANPNPPICAGNPTLLTVVTGIPLTNWFLTRSTSQTVTAGVSVACTVGPNTWWRVYDLNAYALAGPFTITNAQFRVEQANAAQNVTVQLYTQTGAAFPGGTRTPIPGGNVVVAVPAGANQNITANFAVPPVVPNNSIIIVSVSVPAAGWWIGANSGGQSDPGYISAPACTVPNPTNIATLGFPNDHIILNLNGTTGGTTGPLPAGSTVLWSPPAGLSNPSSNPVAASPSVTRQYTALVTLPGGCQTAKNFTVTVNQLPAVVTQPADVAVCQGGNTTFSVTGTGAGITYQWQVSTTGIGGPYANVTNGGVYSGATTSTLTITGATNAMNGYYYRCVINGTCPPAANSNGAKLTVNALPNITINPTGPLCGGVAGINGVALTASGATTYTWAPTTGLYTNATATTAYTGTNLNPVYAAPTTFTTYTVTGTAASTGCVGRTSVIVNYTPPPPTVTPNPVVMCLGDPAVKLKSSSSTSTTVQFCSGPISVPVPDNNPAGATSNIAVSGIPATCNISAMAVTWNMTHTWDGDMVFVLKAPNGNILNLDYYISATGGAAATTGFTNTKISSTGVAALSTGAPAYTGTFRADAVTATIAPFGPPGPTGYAPTGNTWTQLYSVPNGTYTLAMYDGGALDLGILTSWCIDITYVCGVPSTPAVWSPVGGLFSDANATIPYVANTPVDSVWTRPTPAGVYNYNVTVQSLPTPPTVVSTPMTGGNQNSMIFFNVANNNALTYNLTSLSTNSGNSGAVQARVWYKAAPIAGNPGAITAANGWIVSPTYSINVTAGTLNLVSNTLNIPIPAGQTYGIGVEFLGGAVFCGYTNGDGTVDTYTNNGCSIITDGNIGWGGPVAPGPPANNPRNFNGSVSLTPANIPACTSPARVVTVTVNTQPTVTVQPVNQTICTDKVATFSVTATIPLGTIAYQWEVSTNNGNTYTAITNGGVYSGATTPTLTITAPPVSMSGYFYRCRLQGPAPCTPAYSFFRILTVNPLPTVVISASPYVKLFPGLVTTISSTVSPFAAAQYVWRRDGVIVGGANTGTLSVDVDKLGEYQLTVTDVNGCVNASNKITISDSVSANCFLYPNPSGGRFQVRYYSVNNNSVLPRSVTVYDGKGVRVLTQNFGITAPYARMDLDLRPYGKGVYWVEIGDRNGSRLVMCRAVVQ